MISSPFVSPPFKRTKGHGEGSMGDFWVSMWLEGRPVLVLDHLKGAGIRA